jgi:hypothetical protein
MGLTVQDLCQVSNIRFKGAISPSLSVSLLGAAYFIRANFRAKKSQQPFGLSAWLIQVKD